MVHDERTGNRTPYDVRPVLFLVASTSLERQMKMSRETSNWAASTTLKMDWLDMLRLCRGMRGP